MKIKIDKQNNLLSIYCFIIIFSLFSCEKSEKSKIPHPLKNVIVENIEGGAKIFYDTPDAHVVLVTARYKTDDKGVETVRFDINDYPTFIILKGLSTEKRRVELFTVNDNGDYSEIIQVEIDPLLSHKVEYLNNILSTVEIKPVVGGISVDYKDNKESKLLAFNLSYLNDNGDWVDYDDVIEFAEESLTFNIYLPYKEYSLFLTDEELEESNTNSFSITPIIEKELDKSLWTNAELPGDNWRPGPGFGWGIVIENLWDNNPDHSKARFENRSEALPHHFTIDLGEGQHLEISKIKIWHFLNKDHTYRSRHPKIMEIWGSNDPDSDGGWSNWTKLAEYRSIKPSGTPYGVSPTQEDLDYVDAGEEVRIPHEQISSYRYIRFKTLKTWNEEATVERITLSEITIWGVDPN